MTGTALSSILLAAAVACGWQGVAETDPIVIENDTQQTVTLTYCGTSLRCSATFDRGGPETLVPGGRDTTYSLDPGTGAQAWRVTRGTSVQCLTLSLPQNGAGQTLHLDVSSAHAC